jgi:flagellar motor switch protein FliN/FliY
MSAQDALLALAGSTANAIGDVLREAAPGAVEPADVFVPLPGRDPFETPLPALVASAAYVDGVQGGNVFVMPLRAARKLAAALLGREADDEAARDSALTGEELEAVAEAMARLLAAAAAATGAALGQDVEIEAPVVRVAESAREVKVGFQGATRTTIADLRVLGEPCRFIQLIPSVVMMKMTQALQSGPAYGADDTMNDALAQSLRDVPLRVWAELGRARLRTFDVASLADGAIVDLDRAAEDPVDVYVNGSLIATGRLIRIDDKEWAVRLEEVFQTAQQPAATK